MYQDVKRTVSLGVNYCIYIIFILMSNTSLSKFHVNLGRKIQKIRKEKGMTQEELAYKAKIDASYIGYLERGEKNPTLTKLLNISKALKIKMSDLFKID